MFTEPTDFCGVNPGIVPGGSGFGSPRDDSDLMAFGLYPVEQAGDQCEVSDPFGDLVRAGIFSNQCGEPISHSVEVGDSAVHVEPDLHQWVTFLSVSIIYHKSTPFSTPFAQI